MADFDNSANVGRDLILQFIKERMQEKKVTNYRLSKLTGIVESTLGRYFSKEIDMSLLNYLKICGALEIRPYLIHMEMDKNEFHRMFFD